ncbi:amidohydrolase [Longimycelium tulufanense]|uniref:Amidohydrolase n=1 Tax=Longimycelium tulufanense TaxID=907463 RepID=A0A8J3C6D2_9PSEU|nr:amidohydrolase family protein [Longimycelium tulufanense]GGM39764.1 amidohydrolase [Longimycelium tulufanense]
MSNLPKIALEEHFIAPTDVRDGSTEMDPLRQASSIGVDGRFFAAVLDQLVDVGWERIARMGHAGIDVAILSLTSPGVQALRDPAEAVSIAGAVNDFLADVVAKFPDRFAGFATLPLQDPEAAAAELERCVNRLGFKGAMINGYTNRADDGASYLDEPQYLEFWDSVNDLGVPIYLHPRAPLADQQRIYQDHPQLVGAVWGFGVETATHALRLVFSGLFDRLPRLTVILGHLGEMLPYFSWRIQNCFEHNPFGGKLDRTITEYLSGNFYLTTSGAFHDQALLCAALTVGVDRLLFATDYPYESMEQAARWLEQASISENDRRKIAHGNARQLLGIKTSR